MFLFLVLLQISTLLSTTLHKCNNFEWDVWDPISLHFTLLSIFTCKLHNIAGASSENAIMANKSQRRYKIAKLEKYLTSMSITCQVKARTLTHLSIRHVIDLLDLVTWSCLKCFFIWNLWFWFWYFSRHVFLSWPACQTSGDVFPRLCWTNQWSWNFTCLFPPSIF